MRKGGARQIPYRELGAFAWRFIGAPLPDEIGIYCEGMTVTGGSFQGKSHLSEKQRPHMTPPPADGEGVKGGRVSGGRLRTEQLISRGG